MSRATPLAQRHCSPVQGAPMSDAEVAALLPQLDGWAHEDGALQKEHRFADFHRTMAFVNALAWIAHREDHHPELAVSYGGVRVRWSTHSVGGLSINDFVCAAMVDALQP